MVLLPIFLVVLVDVFALTLVYPLLAIYAETFHATPLQATLLVTTFAAFQLVSAPLLGRASDRFGRKPLLIVSQIGTCLGLVLMAKATTLWMLFAARALDGATAANLSLAQASIADNTKPEKRAGAFAIVGVAFGIGFFFGPFVTAELSAYGLTAPIWAAAAMSASSVLLTAAFVPNSKGSQTARLSVFDGAALLRFFQRPRLAPRLAEFFFFITSFTLFTSGFALFAERRFGWTPREIGYLFAYSGAIGIILQGGFIRPLVRRFGEAKLAISGFAAAALSATALGVTYSLPLLLVVAAISSYGNGILRPTLTSLVSRNASDDEQGAVLGLSQALSSLAQIVAPPVAGLLIQYGQLEAWAWIGALAACAGLASSLREREHAAL